MRQGGGDEERMSIYMAELGRVTVWLARTRLPTDFLLHCRRVIAFYLTTAPLSPSIDHSTR